MEPRADSSFFSRVVREPLDSVVSPLVRDSKGRLLRLAARGGFLELRRDHLDVVAALRRHPGVLDQLVLGRGRDIGDHAIDLPRWFGPFTDLVLTVSQVLVFGVTIFLLITLRFIVTKTKLGMAMRALSVNPVATA